MLYPAVKSSDNVIGVDVHTVVIPPAPPAPLPHPYFGPIFLWYSPKFPTSNVLINGLPACSVGSLGYSAHVPMGAPVVVPCVPYWYRYLTNVSMGLVLMTLTTLANIAIAAMSAFIPKPKFAEAFIKDVTGIDTSTSAAALTTIIASFSAFTKWQTWAKLLMPPIPYPGATGSAAIGSPNVTVNGGPLAFSAPLMGTSCSEIPIVPNAATLGFSNVMVGVTFTAMIRGIAVSMAKAGIAKGVAAGVSRLQGNKGSG